LTGGVSLALFCLLLFKKKLSEKRKRYETALHYSEGKLDICYTNDASILENGGYY